MNRKETGSNNQVLKYTGLFGGVQGINVLTSLVRTKFMALLLGPGGMGLASLFYTTLQLLSQATSLGISTGAVREMSERYFIGQRELTAEFVKVVRAWSVLAALFGMLVCVAFGPLLSDITFDWGDHTLHFILLAPAIGMMAITAGETAILKGQRKLAQVALAQVMTAVASIFIAVPTYYIYGEKGIVPVIVMMAFFTMCVTFCFSLSVFPLRMRGAIDLLVKGSEMVKLGVAFSMAGIVACLTEVVVRSYLNVVGDLHLLGLFNAGYMIIMTIGAVMFASMDSDFFPRLSGLGFDPEAVKEIVDKQMKTAVLTLTPLMLALIGLLPVVVPLLFSSQFAPVVPMAQVAALSMFFKAMTLPMAYITLAKGSSKCYFWLETTYYVVFVVLIVIGFHLWGLFGTGIAITVAHVFDFVMITIFVYKKYGFRMSKAVSRYAIVLSVLFALAYLTTIYLDGVLYGIAEVLIMLASFIYAVQNLKSSSTSTKL